MKTLEIDKASAPLGEYVKEIKEEPVIITVDGNPVAALVSIENTDWETITLSTHPQFIELIEQSRKRQKAERRISSEEMRRRLGLEKKP